MTTSSIRPNWRKALDEVRRIPHDFRNGLTFQPRKQHHKDYSWIIPVGFMGFVIVLSITDQNDIGNSLTKALAAGDSEFYNGKTPYAARCTRPGSGYANAFEIGTDANGNKVIAETPALNQPVRAAMCAPK